MAKILVVDDSGLARRTMRRILEETGGHEVIEAEDGILALEKYFLEKPRIVFLDLNMNGMHGIDVLKKIKEIDSNANIVIATADIQSSTRTMVEELGAAGFINKPYIRQQVGEVVNKILGKEAKR